MAKLKIDTEISRTTKIDHTIKVTRALLIQMLREAVAQKIPDNAEATFRIPSGEDYSGMSVDVHDGERVSWSTVHIEP
jgi:hypothetical protein